LTRSIPVPLEPSIQGTSTQRDNPTDFCRLRIIARVDRRVNTSSKTGKSNDDAFDRGADGEPKP
jgi:hypothetical protein